MACSIASVRSTGDLCARRFVGSATARAVATGGPASTSFDFLGLPVALAAAAFAGFDFAFDTFGFFGTFLAGGVGGIALSMSVLTSLRPAEDFQPVSGILDVGWQLTPIGATRSARR